MIQISCVTILAAVEDIPSTMRVGLDEIPMCSFCSKTERRPQSGHWKPAGSAPGSHRVINIDQKNLLSPTDTVWPFGGRFARGKRLFPFARNASSWSPGCSRLCVFFHQASCVRLYRTWTGRPRTSTWFCSRPKTWGATWVDYLGPPPSLSGSLTSMTTHHASPRVSNSATTHSE